MKAKFGYWNDVVFTWLFTHGLKIIIIIAAAYILNRLSKKITSKIVKVSMVNDRHFSEEAEKKRQNTLIRIFTWSITILIILYDCQKACTSIRNIVNCTK